MRVGYVVPFRSFRLTLRVAPDGEIEIEIVIVIERVIDRTSIVSRFGDARSIGELQCIARATRLHEVGHRIDPIIHEQIAEIQQLYLSPFQVPVSSSWQCPVLKPSSHPKRNRCFRESK